MTSGITREMVIAAAGGLRVADPSAAAETTTNTVLRDIVERIVIVDRAAGDIVDFTAYPTPAISHVDGVLIDATTYSLASGATHSHTFAVITTTDAAFTLSGSVTISGKSPTTGTVDGPGARLHTAALSGDVQATTPLDTEGSGALEVSAVGSATRPIETVPATTSPVTGAQRAAAKKTYDKRLKAAKKAYSKAKKKAGSSKKKKAKAKRTYDKKKASYKATYRQAVSGVQVAEHTRTEDRPFHLTISTDAGWTAAA